MLAGQTKSIMVFLILANYYFIVGKVAENSAGPSLLLDTAGDSGIVLRAKLKSAVQRISELARDKEQLIQIGNRLRAELARVSGIKQNLIYTNHLFPTDSYENSNAG